MCSPKARIDSAEPLFFGTMHRSTYTCSQSFSAYVGLVEVAQAPCTLLLACSSDGVDTHEKKKVGERKGALRPLMSLDNALREGTIRRCDGTSRQRK